MMALSTIRDLAAKKAREAARKKLIPFIVERDDLYFLEPLLRGIPFLGDYVPKGYSKIQEDLFVDSSGWGSPGEPAMTFDAFCEEVQKNGPGYGYAVTEAGQFQVYVGVYRKIPKAKKNGGRPAKMS